MIASFREVDLPQKVEHPLGSWLYARLYPGGYDALDVAARSGGKIAQSLRPLTSGWFFIRYTDESGPHLRLRVRPSEGCAGEVFERMTSELTALLGELRPLRGDWKWLPIDASHPPYNSCTAALEWSVYEPEWAKYGGTAGVRVAEQSFEESSDFTLSVLNDPSNTGRTRASLAAHLMDSVVAAVGDERAAFLGAYGEYWLRGAPLYQRGPQLVKHLADPEGVRTLLRRNVPSDDWLTQVFTQSERVHSYLDCASKVCARSRSALLFHQIHMANNRLGITPVEEAVLARALSKGPLA